MSKKLSPQDSELIINEIGVKKLADECALTPGAISLWKVRGMPDYRAKILKFVYPKLSAWKVIESME